MQDNDDVNDGGEESSESKVEVFEDNEADFNLKPQDLVRTFSFKSEKQSEDRIRNDLDNYI